MIERPKGDATDEWLDHPVTKRLRLLADEKACAYLTYLLNCATSSTDPNVVRAAAKYRAAKELEKLLMPEEGEEDAPETRPAEFG